MVLSQFKASRVFPRGNAAGDVLCSSNPVFSVVYTVHICHISRVRDITAV